MPPLTYLHWLSIVISVLFFGTAIALIRAQRRYRSTRRELAAEREEKDMLMLECERLRQETLQQEEFQNALSEAAEKTVFQQVKPEFQHSSRNQQAPERYTYAKRLHDSGVSPEAIAAILSISKHEAEQLASLAKLDSNQ